MSNYVANYVFCNEELYKNFLNAGFEHRLFQEGMYNPIGCILNDNKRLVIFDTRGMEYKRENIETIICRYHDVVWNCVEENRIKEGQFYWDGEKIVLTSRPLQESVDDCIFTIEFFEPAYKTLKVIIGFPDRIIEENYVTNTRRDFGLSELANKRITTYMNNVRVQILNESEHGDFPSSIFGDVLDEFWFWSSGNYKEDARIFKYDSDRIDQKEFDKGDQMIKAVKEYLLGFFKTYGIDIKLFYTEIAEFCLCFPL